MYVVKADIKDLGIIIHLNRLFHLDFPWFKWDSPQWIREELENGNYYIIRDNGNLVAAMCLKMLENEGYIEAIAVQQKKQGSGFGRKLIEFAKSVSRKEGKSKLSVESFCDYKLEGFYEKCGFIKDHELGEYEGHPYYCFSMNL